VRATECASRQDGRGSRHELVGLERAGLVHGAADQLEGIAAAIVNDRRLDLGRVRIVGKEQQAPGNEHHAQADGQRHHHLGQRHAALASAQAHGGDHESAHDAAPGSGKISLGADASSSPGLRQPSLTTSGAAAAWSQVQPAVPAAPSRHTRMRPP
jgi:hypothetical protein